jgi:hypothetical protein
MHFTLFEFTFIPWFIWPDHNTFSFHIIGFELTLIKFTRVSKIILA